MLIILVGSLLECLRIINLSFIQYIGSSLVYVDTNASRSRIKPRFKFIVQIDNIDIEDIAEMVDVHVA